MVDNDVGIIDRSFGFHTALEAAQRASTAAHMEAESAANGMALMKLMGWSTSHIALYSMLSIHEVDCCLIPRRTSTSVWLAGCLSSCTAFILEEGHTVVIRAEGAGQRLILRPDPQQQHDKSGNPVFVNIGAWLKAELGALAEEHAGELLMLKYIDPTYMVHTVAASNLD
ncbi:hypothetical protein BDA96_01G291400 [Sorghum bicolor]|uniref:Phosphofructokinase domain-containing protein n=1 Tax=Sorghum bicolor TaxID=4558 RepID=A0A921UZT5_SORBI|nr:hypothetical protein BDA96_01G291400 [Sorghum bicolor]